MPPDFGDVASYTWCDDVEIANFGRLAYVDVTLRDEHGPVDLSTINDDGRVLSAVETTARDYEHVVSGAWRLVGTRRSAKAEFGVVTAVFYVLDGLDMLTRSVEGLD